MTAYEGQWLTRGGKVATVESDPDKRGEITVSVEGEEQLRFLDGSNGHLFNPGSPSPYDLVTPLDEEPS